MKTNRRGCKCKCINWEICNCDCICKEHRYHNVPSHEEIEKKKQFFKNLKYKKEKEQLEQDIDNIIFGKEKERVDKETKEAFDIGDK